jgi:thiol-disulfide isomerase/thioredoxin
MRVCVIAVVCLVAASASADPFDQVLAKAGDKPVVIEFGATWCKPCKAFAAQILPRADVRIALAQVVFVTYDLDTDEGEAVAKRYAVSAVPAFVAVAGPNGEELERLVGLPSPPSFIGLLGRAPASAKRAVELARDLELHPDDPAVRLRLADFERAAGRDTDALVHYRDVIVMPDIDPVTLAHARAAMARLVTGGELTRGLDHDALELAIHPGTVEATRELVRLAVAHRLGAYKLRTLAAQHLARLEMKRWEDIADAIRAAILAGAVDEARRASETWASRAPKHHPAMQIASADIAMYLGYWQAAYDDLRETCASPPAGYELACYARLTTLAGGHRVAVPGIGHLAFATAAALHGRTPDPSVDLEALADLDAGFGFALARELLDATHSCGGRDRASLSISFVAAATWGPPTAVVVTGTNDRALAACVHDAIAGHALPPAPVEQTSFTLPLEIAKPAARSEAPVAAAPVAPDVPPDPIDPDVVAFAALRTGAVETRGVGAQGLVDVTRLDHARLVALGQAEVGTGDATASFVAHAMVGIGYASHLFGVWSLAAGVGASQYGDMAPAAFEFPLQARLAFSLWGVRCALWGQSVVFPKNPMRQQHRMGGDEVSVGLSASIPRTHVFVGATVEDRIGGTAGVVMIGVPLVFGP